METDSKSSLLCPNTAIRQAFEMVDKDKKGYLNGEERDALSELLISKYKLDQDHVRQVFSVFPSDPKTKLTLNDIENGLNAHQGKGRSHSASREPKLQRGLDCVGLSTDEQVIPAARIIYVLQMVRNKLDTDKTLLPEIDWCIEQIATGHIYDPRPTPDSVEWGSPGKQALPWLAPFSTPKLNMEEIQQFLLKMNELSPQSAEQVASKEKERVKRRSVVAQSLADEASRIEKFLDTINSPDFDVVTAEKVLGRDKVLPLVAFRVFQEHKIFSKTSLDENAFVAFVSEIRKGYVKDNPYHNDVHAADVLQMCHYILTKGEVEKVAKLTSLDVAALLLSAIIHDYRHPGVTNGFLINSSNDLAIGYNDKSVLENYHVSEAFKLMHKEKDCDLFKSLTNNERILIRKRIISCVLGTDMAVHSAMMMKLHNLIITHTIHKGKNNHKIINPKDEFESKQFILDLCLHFSDCGNPCREFSVYKPLVVRLLEEFGRQGDIEKGMKMPVSFLCDRTTVNLPSAQIGFIAGVIKPMVNMFVEVFPNTNAFLKNLCNNEQEWKKFPKQLQ